MKRLVPQCRYWEEGWRRLVPSCLVSMIFGTKCAGVPDFSTSGREQTRIMMMDEQKLRWRNDAM